MAHVESDLHHMAVRVEKRHPKGETTKVELAITVVESENEGMTRVGSWPEAKAILDGWLAADEPNLKEFELRTRTVGF